MTPTGLTDTSGFRPGSRRGRVLGAPPVEELHRVGAGVGAVPAADAPRVDLVDDALVVDGRRLHRTHQRARRAVAVHAGLRHESRPHVRPLPFDLGAHPHPRDRAVLAGRLRPADGDVVLRAAGNLARLAPVAPLEIDDHSPARHADLLRRGTSRTRVEYQSGSPLTGSARPPTAASGLAPRGLAPSLHVAYAGRTARSRRRAARPGTAGRRLESALLSTRPAPAGRTARPAVRAVSGLISTQVSHALPLSTPEVFEQPRHQRPSRPTRAS